MNFPFIPFMTRQVIYPKVQFPHTLSGDSHALENDEHSPRAAQPTLVTIRAPLNSRGRPSHDAGGLGLPGAGQAQ